MKLIVATIVILGFVSIAVFGFLVVMNSKNSPNLHGCMAATINGGACPQQANVFSFASFHLSAFQSFGTAVLVLLALIGLFIVLNWQLPDLIGFFRKGSLAFPTVNPPREKISHWLSLFENSPNYF